MSDRWSGGSGLDQSLAEIAGAKLAQSEFGSAKVIYARGKRG